jgi:hypothetical protein
MSQHIHVPGGYGRAFFVKAGQYFTITNTYGQQVVDLIAFNASNFNEFLSTSHTRVMLGRINVQKGDTFYTNYRQPILQLVEDDVGCHDLICAACDPMRYKLGWNLDHHRSCRMNFTEVLQPYAIEFWRIPDPVNLFQNTPILPDGTIGFEPSKAKKGDKLVLEAKLHALVAVSACPQDLIPINGEAVTDVDITVHDSLSPS